MSSEGIPLVSATASSGERAIYRPITPCRLADTRADSQVGPRSTPIGANEVWEIDASGPAGTCTVDQLPADATALQLNITAVGATLPTFLAVFPDGTDVPTSSLNPVPGQPPVPNAVTTQLAAHNSFRIFNLQGTVQVIVDVVGIYRDHDHDDRYDTKAQVDTKIADAIAANAGPQGPAGPAGAAGANAMELAGVVTVSSSGGDFTDLTAALASVTTASAANPVLVHVGPGIYTFSQAEIPRFVHLQGSGPGTTILRSTFSNAAPPFTGAAQALTMRADTRLSDLTVDVAPPAGQAVAVGTFIGSRIAVENVDIIAISQDADAHVFTFRASSNAYFHHVRFSADAGPGDDAYGLTEFTGIVRTTITDSFIEADSGLHVQVTDAICDNVSTSDVPGTGPLLSSTCT